MEVVQDEQRRCVTEPRELADQAGEESGLRGAAGSYLAQEIESSRPEGWVNLARRCNEVVGPGRQVRISRI